MVQRLHRDALSPFKAPGCEIGCTKFNPKQQKKPQNRLKNRINADMNTAFPTGVRTKATAGGTPPEEDLQHWRPQLLERWRRPAIAEDRNDTLYGEAVRLRDVLGGVRLARVAAELPLHADDLARRIVPIAGHPPALEAHGPLVAVARGVREPFLADSCLQILRGGASTGVSGG